MTYLRSILPSGVAYLTGEIPCFQKGFQKLSLIQPFIFSQGQRQPKSQTLTATESVLMNLAQQAHPSS